MVEDAEPPWNIGVFGEWGSGKTSIIRMLYSRLRGVEADYVCVEFDAWKHAEDSIRTDLLLNLDQAIGKRTGQTDEAGNDAVLGEDKITRELYDVEEKQRREDLFPWEEAERIITESPLVGGTTFLILGIIIVGAVVNLLNIVGAVEITNPTISSINSVLSAFLFPLFISVFVFMAGEVRKATTALQRKHPRKEWSGAYEQLFDDILEGTDADKVLISIDNLDRCESNTVYDVLVSLKTFLQSQDCIYIIPCDDQALQSHIESIDTEGDYFEEQPNEREFLRKFFQTHIRIPDFIDEDIEKYAKSRNQELAEPFDDTVLDVITKAYVRNPRSIKQSLNRLTTLRILSEQMEEANHLDNRRLTDSLDFLAKIMILEEDYPSFYSELQDDTRLLEDVNDYLRGNVQDADRKSRIERLLGNGEGGNKSETKLEQFLRSTLRCTVDNPKPFLQLGEPSFASALSDGDALIQNLRTNQENEVREELQTVKQEKQNLTAYTEIINNTFDDYTREGREGPLFSSINTLVAVFDEFDGNGQEDIAAVLGKYLALEQVQDFYTDFDPEEFFPVLLKIPDPDQTTVFKRFATTVVTDSKLRKNVLEVFVENAGDVPRTAAESLCLSLLDLSDSEFEGALDTLSSRKESKKLATPKLLERAATLVSWNESRNRFQETKHYKQFDNEAQPRGRQHFVEVIFNFRSEVSNEDRYYTQVQEELSQLNGEVTRATGSRLYNELNPSVLV